MYTAYPETTNQLSEGWPKRSRQSRPKVKAMVTVYFDLLGVMHYELLPPDQTVNDEFYLRVMRRLRKAIRLEKSELWTNNCWFSHHNNAPSHIPFVLRDHFAENPIQIIPQPPYSPCGFWLFPKLNRPVR